MDKIKKDASSGQQNQQSTKSMFETRECNYQYNGKTVRFKILASCIVTNVGDIINAATLPHLEGKTSMDIVEEYLKTSMYSKREFDFVSNDLGELEVWVSRFCARDFVKKLSCELYKWYNPILKKLEKRRSRIYAAISMHTPHWYFKEVLKPCHEDYIYTKGDAIEGLVQTFYHNNHRITLCLTESEVLVNANQIVDIQKRDCSEWFDLETTKEIFTACNAKNQMALCASNVDRTGERITPVWLNIALAEDLTQWLTNKPSLRLWLQNRAAELRFFSETSLYDYYRKAVNNDEYIYSNCKISRI